MQRIRNVSLNFVASTVDYSPVVSEKIDLNLNATGFWISYPSPQIAFGKVSLRGGSLTASSAVILSRLDMSSCSVSFPSATIEEFVANSGTFESYRGASTVTVNRYFLLSNTMNIGNGVQFVLACNSTLGSGANFDGLGTITINTRSTSAGLWVSTGTVSIYNQLELISGRIVSANGVTLRLHYFKWTGGHIYGPGLIALYNAPSISASYAVVFESGSIVQNYGDLKWAVPESFPYIPSTFGVLSNMAGASIEVTGDGAVALPVALDNRGSIVLKAPTTVLGALNNTGNIEAEADLTLTKVNSCSGSISVAGALIYDGSVSSSFACSLQANEFTIAGKLATATRIEVDQLYPVV